MHVTGFFTHFVSRFASVGGQIEFNDDHRQAFVTARGQRVDTGNRVDRFFDFFTDFALDNFRRCARVFGGHDHDRQVDIWELVYLERLKRKQAQHHQGEHDHGGKHRIAQTDLGEPHGLRFVRDSR